MRVSPGHLLEPLFRLAETAPDEALFTLVDERGRDSETRTRREFAENVVRTAGWLTRSCGLAPGDVVLLVYPTSMALIEAYAACLLAGIVATPVYPPNPVRPEADLDRLRSIAAQVKISAILTSSAYRAATHVGRARGLVTGADVRWPKVPWLVTDGRKWPLSGAFVPPEPTDASLALLQFTSGSTGAPRGVRLTHGNLRHQLAFNRERLGCGPDTVGVMWVPPYHDLGLISFMTTTLAGNARLYVLSPLAFLASPAVWLETIHRVRGTHTASPNFGFDLVVRKTTEAQRRAWDLSCVRVLMSAAEPIVPATVDRFFDAFAASGLSPDAFCPAYGLAEHTVGVTLAPGRATRLRVDRASLTRDHLARIDGVGGDLEISGCGTPSHGIAVRIVDPDTRAARTDGEIGEIWVQSPSVADGYAASPDASGETFGARLSGADGAWLRTGDLGFLHRGELYVTGRLKDLVIVRGRNLHPEDVEQVVRGAHPAIRPGGVVAFAAPGAATEALVIWAEVLDESQAAAVLPAVVERVASAFGVRPTVAIVPQRTVLKTTSGKPRRNACAAAWAAGTIRVLAQTPRPTLPAGSTDVSLRAALDEASPEERLQVLAEGILALAVGRLGIAPPAELDPEATLTELGCDSVTSVEIRSALERELDVELPAALFMEAASVAELSARVLSRAGLAFVAAHKAAPPPVARMPWRNPPDRALEPARTRVAVVGAGIGGLVAALELARLGFTRITLFEASPLPGGKIHTAWPEGAPVELGQVYLLDTNRVVLELVNDLGLELSLLSRELRMWEDGYGLEEGPAPGPRLAWARKVLSAANLPLDPELPFPSLIDFGDEPLGSFLRRNGLLPVHPGFEIAWHGMGYGGMDVPVGHVLAYLQVYAPSRGIGRLAAGSQELCFALARELREVWGVDLRFECPVERVGPTDDGVVVQVSGAAERFDEVILAVPPAVAGRLVPPGPLGDLLARFSTHRFFVAGVKAPALPVDGAVYRPGCIGKTGIPVVYQSSAAPTGWHFAGSYLDDGPGTPETSVDVAYDEIEAHLRQLGGEVTRGPSRAWEYFPRPRTDGVATLRAIEALQGHDRLWLTGSYLAFETIEHTARHARHLVRTCFGT